MKQISLKTPILYQMDELKILFSSVGWAKNLSESQLFKAMKSSSHYAIVRKDDKLVGFARSMDDGIYSANIDCVVVHKDYQHQGIAKQLIIDLLKQLKGVQYISVSPNESENVSLYLKCGFELIEDGRLLQISNVN